MMQKATAPRSSKQAVNLQRPAPAGEFTVLLSHWSDSLNWHPPRFNHAAQAHEWAAPVVFAQPGITYVLLCRPLGHRNWVSEDGRTVAEHQYHFHTGLWPSENAKCFHEK